MSQMQWLRELLRELLALHHVLCSDHQLAQLRTAGATNIDEFVDFCEHLRVYKFSTENPIHRLAFCGFEKARHRGSQHDGTKESSGKREYWKAHDQKKWWIGPGSDMRNVVRGAWRFLVRESWRPRGVLGARRTPVAPTGVQIRFS